MRIADPLIVGAGPAGCAAAIVLARGGVPFRWIDKRADVGDPLCGGFLSWRGAESLHALGLTPEQLGAHPINTVALFVGDRCAEAPLPAIAYGLSRRALDGGLRAVAAAQGAVLTTEQFGVVPASAPDGLFLATGKYLTRGDGRPRDAGTLGLRWRFMPNAETAAALSGRIELHLFRDGYAGLLLQEDGSANLALAVRKRRIRGSHFQGLNLLRHLAKANPALGARLAGASLGKPDAVGAVPYGYVAKATGHGVFRLGDEAAVIPSLAGEGLSIALGSGLDAATAFLTGGAAAAEPWQHRFAAAAQVPVRRAQALWWLAERPFAADMAVWALRQWPALAAPLGRATRLPLLEQAS